MPDPAKGGKSRGNLQNDLALTLKVFPFSLYLSFIVIILIYKIIIF